VSIARLFLSGHRFGDECLWKEGGERMILCLRLPKDFGARELKKRRFAENEEADGNHP